MKKRSLIALIVLVALFISSCRDITVKTIINEDGTFTRFIIVNSEDSADVYTADLPYPIDDSWQVIFAKDSAKKDKPFTLTYSKLFHGSEDLNRSLNQDTGWKKALDREIEVDKRYGLFYSYLEFRETIKAANPFTYLDYKDYLSMEDIRLLKGAVLLANSADSARFSKAEEKAEEFLLDSFTAEIIFTLKQGVLSLNDPKLKPDEVDLYADSIKHKIEHMDTEKTDVFIDYLVEWSGNSDYRKLRQLSPGLFSESDKRMQMFYNIIMMEEYDQKVEMPGLLTETTAVSVVGNLVFWKVEPIAFMFEDYEMYAESRVVNWWAFGLSGLVILTLIILLLIRAFRRAE